MRILRAGNETLWAVLQREERPRYGGMNARIGRSVATLPHLVFDTP